MLILSGCIVCKSSIAFTICGVPQTQFASVEETCRKGLSAGCFRISSDLDAPGIGRAGYNTSGFDIINNSNGSVPPQCIPTSEAMFEKPARSKICPARVFSQLCNRSHNIVPLVV